MSSEQEDKNKKLLASSTYGKTTSPKHVYAAQPHSGGDRVPEVSPRANLACVVLVFLEDWQAGRLTADEVCETLLAAAIARGLLKGTLPTKANK